MSDTNPKFHVFNTLGGELRDFDPVAPEMGNVSSLSSMLRRGVSEADSKGFKVSEAVDSVIRQIGGGEMEGEDLVASLVLEISVSRRNQIANMMIPSFNPEGPSGPAPTLSNRATLG